MNWLYYLNEIWNYEISDKEYDEIIDMCSVLILLT